MVPIAFLRQFRIFNYAIFDFAAAFLGIYLLAPLLSRFFRLLKIDIPRKSWMYLTLPMSIPAHLLSGRITPMTADFIEPNGHYLLKGLIIGLLIMGLKDIKKLRK